MRPITAADVMNPNVLTVQDDMTVEELASFLVENEISGAPVEDSGGRLVGVVSVTDLALSVAKGIDLIAKRGKPEIPDWTELASRNPGYGGTVQRMIDNHPPATEIGYAFLLRNVKYGWTLPQRKTYFQFLNQAAKGSGGALRSSCASCSDSSRAMSAIRLACRCASTPCPFARSCLKATSLNRVRSRRRPRPLSRAETASSGRCIFASE